MASLNVSEIQFMLNFYAKFNALHNYSFETVRAVNQREEGTQEHPYRGTDLVLDNYFFQFKMPKYLNDTRAKKEEQDKVGLPYFRFKVYNTPSEKTSPPKGQLDFLKEHCLKKGNKVYYVVPMFDRAYSNKYGSSNFWFDAFYKSNDTKMFDFVHFLDIRTLSTAVIEQNDNHVIIYSNNDKSSYYYCSNPVKVKTNKKLRISLQPYLKRKVNNYKTLDVVVREMYDLLREWFGPEQIGSIINDNKINLRSVQFALITLLGIFWHPITIIPDNLSQKNSEFSINSYL